jgi:hypothetical protein
MQATPAMVWSIRRAQAGERRSAYLRFWLDATIARSARASWPVM